MKPESKEVLNVKDYEKLIIKYLNVNVEITTQKAEELTGKHMESSVI